MDIFYKSVSVLNYDKTWQFIAGLLISAMSYLCSDMFTAFCCTIVIGIAKEAYDVFADGTFDMMDLVTTLIGFIIGCLMIMAA